MADLAPQLSSASRGLTAEASLIPPATGLSSRAVGPVAPTVPRAAPSAGEDGHHRPALAAPGIDFGAEGEEPDPSPKSSSAVLTLENVDPQAEDPYMLPEGSETVVAQVVSPVLSNSATITILDDLPAAEMQPKASISWRPPTRPEHSGGRPAGITSRRQARNTGD